MAITYVSAFLLQQQGRAKHDFEDYCLHFETLAASGLLIALFLDQKLPAVVSARFNRFPNVRIVAYVTLAETALCRALFGKTVQLPQHRDEPDSLEYMLIGNSKLEWLQRAARANPFATSHFAWIDFGIAHILTAPEATLGALKSFEPRYPIIAPGCYRRNPYNDAQIWSQICWHYCGGFLVCDAAHAEYLNDEFLHCVSVESPRFSWDVNFWALLELRYGVPFRWYQAEFDDSLLSPPPAMWRDGTYGIALDLAQSGTNPGETYLGDRRVSVADPE